MKQMLFALHDRVTGTFGPVFCAVNGATATRNLGDEVNRADPNNQLHMHANDFDLYHVGWYDTETAAVSPEASRVLVVRAEDLRQ